MGKRQKRREQAKLKLLKGKKAHKTEEKKEAIIKKDERPFLKAFYEDNYKKLLIIPFLLLVAAIIQIGVQNATTGDFLIKDVSLKGGVTIILPTSDKINIDQLENDLLLKYPEATFSSREMSRFGDTIGLIVDSDISPDKRDDLISYLVKKTNVNRKDISIEEIGSSLGSSFFRQTMVAIIIAFFFMGLVVFLYFRHETKNFRGWAKLWGLIPSGAVILSALSDIIVTLAVVNILGIKLSTAGIAAFLMLIGYSVDTDILLTIRVIKRKEGTTMERIYGAIKTGFTMNMTTLAAVSVALLISESAVITQIMTILFIGLFADMINTWIQNVGLVRIYQEKKEGKR